MPNLFPFTQKKRGAKSAPQRHRFCQRNRPLCLFVLFVKRSCFPKWLLWDTFLAPLLFWVLFSLCFLYACFFLLLVPHEINHTLFYDGQDVTLFIHITSLKHALRVVYAKKLQPRCGHWGAIRPLPDSMCEMCHVCSITFNLMKKEPHTFSCALHWLPIARIKREWLHQVWAHFVHHSCHK